MNLHNQEKIIKNKLGILKPVQEYSKHFIFSGCANARNKLSFIKDRI